MKATVGAWLGLVALLTGCGSIGDPVEFDQGALATRLAQDEAFRAEVMGALAQDPGFRQAAIDALKNDVTFVEATRGPQGDPGMDAMGEPGELGEPGPRTTLAPRGWARGWARRSSRG